MTHALDQLCRPPGSLPHCCQHRVAADSPGDPAQAGNAGVSMVALHLRQATIPGLCVCPPWRQLWPAWQLLAEEGDTKGPRTGGGARWESMGQNKQAGWDGLGARPEGHDHLPRSLSGVSTGEGGSKGVKSTSIKMLDCPQSWP